MRPARLRRTVLAIAWTGFAVLFMTGLPTAGAAAAKANDTCFMCHGDKDAKGSTGNAIAVDPDVFAHSVHGGASLPCTACHADVSADRIPHAEQLKPVDCANCHAQQVKEYRETVHGKARQGGNKVAASCTDCHGKHDIRKAADLASRTNHANLEATCGKCHGNDAVVRQAKLPGGNIGSQFHDSIHGRALKGAAQAAAPTCTNCHGAHSIRAKDDPQSRTNRATIPDTCGACHAPVKAAFSRGQHGKLRHDGNLAAPGCNDCHTAHQIQPHDSPTFITAVVDQCGTCHQEYLTTYRDTYHGQATGLGFARIATCASCHGGHEVLPASNPASKVSPQNRVATCQQCHAGASANFASYDPHANRHDRARNPFYYYSAKFMEWLLIGVFGFFGVHTLLWFGRLLVEQRSVRSGRNGRKER
jgi:nitrate/TMAO reductase-like tetraheme cytochrome c subunit